MKKYTKILAVAIAAIMTIGSIVFVSCNKEDNDDVSSNLSGRMEKADVVLPKNANNPYDTIGALHNNMMEECREEMQSYYLDHGTWSVTASDSIATAILADHGLYVPGYNLNFITSLLADSASYYIDYAVALGATNAEKENITNIVTTIKDLVFANEPYSQIKERIVNEEALVLSNQGLTNDEKFVILSTTSVLRHSLYYWLTYGGFDTGMSPSAKEDKPSQNNNSGRGWRIALADLGGTLTGAVSGLSAGAAAGTALGNPAAGVAIGTVVGAIGGAVKASCDQATKEANKNQAQQTQGE